MDTDTNVIPKPQHLRLLPCAHDQVFALRGALHAVDDATIKALRATLEQRRPKPYHGIIVLMDPDVAGRQGVDPSFVSCRVAIPEARLSRLQFVKPSSSRACIPMPPAARVRHS